MIIKEYRIPMPLDVEEYRIAQLYMIAKKSRLESQGSGSGVEIITNDPYENGPGGNGQYTEKVYHIEHHLPGWLKAFLPRSMSTIREDAWNAYPFSKNRIYASFLEKFSIEIESKYVIGGQHIDNIFNLEGTDLKERTIDMIDFVNDQLTGSDYSIDEDPREYISKTTGRGPLATDWLKQFSSEHKDKSVSNEVISQASGDTLLVSNDDNEYDNNQPLQEQKLMCVYKLCKVQFNYWPMQWRVEDFIQAGIRRTLVRAHRQAWAWQDEWHGLEMDDIRRMEKETQECLANVMRQTTAE